MKNTFILTSSLLMLAIATATQAGTVTLTPAELEVMSGSSFEVSLDLDLADEPGAHPGSFGGAVMVSFDTVDLSLVGFTASGAATIVDSLPTVPGVDCLDVAVVCFVDAPDVSTVGSFTFTLNAGAVVIGQSTTIDLMDADDGFGSFANALPTNQAALQPGAVDH